MSLYGKLAFSLLIFALSPVFAQQSCEALFDRSPQLISKKNFSEAHKIISTQVESIKDDLKFMDIFIKLQRADWNSYKLVSDLLVTLEAAPLSNIEKLSLKRDSIKRNEEYEILLKQSLADPQYLENYKKHIDDNYNYFLLLEKVNEKIGAQVFPHARLDLVVTNRETIKQGEAQLKIMNEDFERHFELTGYKSMEEYRNFVESVNPESKKLLQDIQKHLFVTIQRPENARFWIPLTGFQNQRTTGTSKGSFNPKNRDDAEKTYLNMEKYQSMSTRFKVKNAAMDIDFKETGLKRNMNYLNQFGTDHWVIKESVLEKRATWTPMNSLEAAQYIKSLPNEKINILNRAIPWKYRELVLPYIKKEAGQFDLTKNNSIYKMNDIISNESYYKQYFEVQILGDLSLDDMSVLHFKSNPPDQQMMKLLKSKNIEVYDARGEFPVKYEGQP
jgi:hypothetical protein